MSEGVLLGLDPFIDCWVSEWWRHVFGAGVLVDQEPLSLGKPLYVAMRMAKLHDASSATSLVSTDCRYHNSDSVDDGNDQGRDSPNGDVWPRTRSGELRDQIAGDGAWYCESLE